MHITQKISVIEHRLDTRPAVIGPARSVQVHQKAMLINRLAFWIESNLGNRRLMEIVVVLPCGRLVMQVEFDESCGREPSPRRLGIYGIIRTAADYSAACVLAALLAPVIAVLALLVKRASPGPVFYTQTRLGLNGRPFQIWKLRTMSHNCEAVTGPVWASLNDTRVTPIGRILRDTHLDELPQLWNVLRGEMSLIGPRPERPEIARRIEAAVPGFHLRLQIKPGLTGLAQLRLPADQDIAFVPRKLAQDLHYLQHQGALLDLYILLSTAFHVLGTVCMCVSKMLVKDAAPKALPAPVPPPQPAEAPVPSFLAATQREVPEMTGELTAAA
jgi:lipopolysaccharide/colanic/teichoic acid biosynthesis glycosyltransferase